jgi:hypothetical protein
VGLIIIALFMIFANWYLNQGLTGISRKCAQNGTLIWLLKAPRPRPDFYP